MTGIAISHWASRLRRRRDALLSDPRFQRWVASFAPLRPLARRRAQALFDLCAGFVYSQVLGACVRLGVLNELGRGPRSAAEIAASCELPAEAAQMLLDAAVSIDLLERRGGGTYGLGPHGAALLGNPGVLAMIAHHHLLYEDLRDPVALLRDRSATTRLREYWSYSRAGPPEAQGGGRTAAYSTLMDASQPLVAAEIIGRYPFAQHRRVLDVGGGEGAFLAAVAEAAPAVELELFDLPEVAARARERLDARGLGARLRCHGGSFLDEALPAGADLITLVRIVHDHDDAEVLRLLQNARRALAPGGRLLIAEPMAGADAAGRMCDAYLAFYLWAMGQGRPRTPERLREMLRSCGFTGIRRLRTGMPMVVSLLVATAD
jgi:demethylspheroidene O-methyltransferase